MKNKIIVIAALLLMIFTMVGCSKDDDIEFYTTDEAVFEIETPFCNLYYPEKWEEQITTKCVEKNGGYVVSFNTKLDGKDTKVFDIAIGGKKGTLIGSFEKDDQEIKVYVIEHIDDINVFDEDQRMIVGGMMEDINVIISKLIEEYDLEIVQ